MVELIVVVLIIGIMATTILAGSSNRREKILEANTTASDFYSVLQAEFTSFQMFDGPLTMTLNRTYNDGGLFSSIDKNGDKCGLKYFPAIGGNYPYEGYVTGEDHMNGLPKDAALYVEFYVFGGKLRRVDYANELDVLLAMEKDGGNSESAELCMVLNREMADRMEYRDGYYYARISYKAPTSVPGRSKYDYREVSVTVDWTAFCASEITVSDADNTVFQMQNMLRVGGVCGVHTSNDYQTLGTTGTDFLSEGV